MTQPEKRPYLSSFILPLLNEEVLSLHDAALESPSSTATRWPFSENIPNDILSRSRNLLESIVRQKASQWNIDVSFRSDFICENDTSSSRFLSKMSSSDELNEKCKSNNTSKFVSVTLTSLSKAALGSCQTEIFKGFFIDADSNPLLSINRIPNFGDVGSCDLTPAVINYGKSHLTLISSCTNIHLQSRLAYTNLLEKKGYSSFIADLSTADTISLLVYAGPFHLSLQNYLSNNRNCFLLLPSALMLSSSDKLVVADKNGKSQSEIETLSLNLLQESKKIEIYSKQFAFDAIDFFYTIHHSCTKAKLSELLFRNGCALRILADSASSTIELNFNEVSISLYAQSMDAIDEVYHEICILFCSISNQFEITQLNSMDYYNVRSTFESILEFRNAEEHVPLQMFGTCTGSKSFVDDTSQFSGTRSDQSYLFYIKGSKSNLFKILSKFQPSSSTSTNDGDNEDVENSFNELTSISSKTYSQINSFPSFNYFSHTANFSFKLGSLSDDSDFISGKKDGKLLKISRITDCQLHMELGLGWRVNIKISSQNLSFLIKAVELLEGEFPASLSFFIPDHHHKRIIGHGGKHIQKWMKTFGVYVKFSNNINSSRVSFQNQGDKTSSLKDTNIQLFQPNVLIRTPAKNFHALIKMKFAILELAAEGDKTLTVVCSHQLRHVDDFFSLTSMVPEMFVSSNLALPSAIFYYVGFLELSKRENIFIASVPLAFQSSNSSTVTILQSDDNDTVSAEAELPDQSYLQSIIGQDLEASIESLVDGIFQSDSNPSQLLSNSSSSIENRYFNSKVSSTSYLKTILMDYSVFSMGAINKGFNVSPKSSTVNSTIPFKQKRDAHYWDSIFDRASISIGNAMPSFSSNRLSAFI